MLDKLRCARCGSSRIATAFPIKGRVQTGGSKLTYRGWKRFAEYSATAPICSICKQKFEKYEAIKFILVASFLIELFTTLIVIYFWFHMNFAYTMIALFSTTLFLGIILMFSRINPSWYMKFKTRKRAFYVKPKSAKKWIPLEDYKRNPLYYIPEPIEATDKIIAKKKKPKSKKHKVARKYYNLGKTLLKKGDLEDAINYFNISINFYPNDAKVFSEKGEALLKLG